MRGFYRLAAVSAASFSILVSSSPGAAQPASGTPGVWWYLGETGAAPDRRLFFIDRSALARRGDEASIRVSMAFERPRNGIKGFDVTYEFRCAKRQKRTRDAVFMQADGSVAPDQRPAEAWDAAAPGSPAATVLEAACRGAFPGEAYAIARAPLAEAQRVFAAGSAPSRGGLLPREALAQCLRGTAPDSPACRAARASAERGRAAGPSLTAPRGSAPPAGTEQQSYAQLLDRIVAEDAQAWEFNRYEPGSMEIVEVRRDAQGNIAALRGNYRYGASARLTGTVLDGFAQALPSSPPGWVEARFVNGRLHCLQYHDRAGCIASTRDHYRQANEAARERQEYCAVTRNC